MKERWFNYRPLTVVFVFLLLGSLFAFYINKAVAITIIVSLIFVGLILFTAITRKKLIYAILPVVAFALGLGLYNLGVYNFNKNDAELPQTIEARIFNVPKPTDGSMALYADSVKFNGKDANTNLTIYLYDSSGLFNNIQIGSIIKFSPKNFYKSDLFYSKTPNAFIYNNNLKYVATVDISNVEYLKTDKTFAENIKEYIKTNLKNGLTNENVEIAYSALFGDDNLLGEGQRSAFQLSGVAHLLAVSGLHVSIIVAILYKFLDLLRIKRWPRVIVVSILLVFYAYICNFSVSVIRASIMSILALIAPLVYRQYDSLSALSFAGIIIFLVNPLCIFDISFLMSFSCSAGIIMLYRPINEALNHTKMPKWLINSIALTLCATVSLIFIMAFYFHRLNLISLAANLVIVPIFTIAFTIIFVLAICSLILPFITYLLIIINPFLNLISLTSTLFAGLPFANFATSSINYICVMLYFVVIFLLGRFCTARKEHKFLLGLPIVAILIAVMV